MNIVEAFNIAMQSPHNTIKIIGLPKREELFIAREGTPGGWGKIELRYRATPTIPYELHIMDVFAEWEVVK